MKVNAAQGKKNYREQENACEIKNENEKHREKGPFFPVHVGFREIIFAKASY